MGPGDQRSRRRKDGGAIATDIRVCLAVLICILFQEVKALTTPPAVPRCVFFTRASTPSTRGRGTALYRAKEPQQEPSKGNGKSTRPNTLFSPFERVGDEPPQKMVLPTNSTIKAPSSMKTPKVMAGKKSKVPPKRSDLTGTLPTINIVDKLQQSFSRPKDNDGLEGTQQSESASLPFFAINKEPSLPPDKPQGPLQRGVAPVPRKPLPTKSSVVDRPMVKRKPPPSTKRPLKTEETSSPSIRSTLQVNPLQRAQNAIETKQAQVQQKALEAKEKVVEAVETTKAKIDSSVSTLQQWLDDLSKIPKRIQTAYTQTVQFLQTIPPQVQSTVQKITAIPNQIQTSAIETKDKITAIPGRIVATKNTIVNSIDQAMAQGQQTIQNIIDFPNKVRQQAMDIKMAVENFLYDVKVLFQQAPPRPKPPESPPMQKPVNPIVGFVVWMLRGVVNLTGKAVTAGAEAVVEQVRKQTSLSVNEKNDDTTPPTLQSLSPVNSKLDRQKKRANRSIDDINCEAKEAVRLAEDTLQRFKSSSGRNSKSKTADEEKYSE